MANTWIEFLKEMEQKQIEDMRKEWVKEKSRIEVVKELEKLKERMEMERELPSENS